MNFQTINASASPEVQVNENFETIDFASVYGKRQPVTTGLTWGYYGGRWGGFAVAAGTLALTNTADNHVVVLRSSGAISTTVAATNWNNTALYARVYKLTCAGGVVTVIEDHRAGPGGLSGAGASSAGSFAGAETPAGTINSSNTVFTLAVAPTPAASLQLFLNGMLQLAGGVHYTLSGLTITFAVAATPQTGDNLIAFYRY